MQGKYFTVTCALSKRDNTGCIWLDILLIFYSNFVSVQTKAKLTFFVIIIALSENRVLAMNINAHIQ